MLYKYTDYTGRWSYIYDFDSRIQQDRVLYKKAIGKICGGDIFITLGYHRNDDDDKSMLVVLKLPEMVLGKCIHPIEGHNSILDYSEKIS